MLAEPPLQAACQSAAVQSRQFAPSNSQEASASAPVTFVQGILFCNEQPRPLELNPALVGVASFRLASNLYMVTFEAET